MQESMLMGRRDKLKLWFHMDPSKQSDLTTIRELVSDKALTRTGNPVITSDGPADAPRCVTMTASDGRDWLTYPYVEGSVPNMCVGDFDISLWHYPFGTGMMMLAADWIQLPYQSNWALWNQNGRITFGFSPYSQDANILTAPYNIPVNTWTHIRVTRVGNLFTLYFNGVPVTTATSTQTRTSRAGNMVTIGVYQGSNGLPPDTLSGAFNGRVALVKIYGMR